MPRYFFHLRNGVSKPDRDGVELADREEAWSLANKLVGDIIRDLDGKQRPGWGWTMDVMEDGWQPCWSLSFRTDAFVPDPRK